MQASRLGDCAGAHTAKRASEVWVTNTQVNFCAKAYPTVPSGHADAPALSVLAAFLRNGFLHRSIREQGGAYGGGASHDPNIAAFRFFSYRDPRLVETLTTSTLQLRWLLESQHEQLALEEAILSVMASLDKPGSPAGEAKRDFHERLFKRTAEHRKLLRAASSNTTIDDLRRVADTYLKPELASTAVITHTAGAETEQRTRTESNSAGSAVIASAGPRCSGVHAPSNALRQGREQMALTRVNEQRAVPCYPGQHGEMGRRSLASLR